MIPEAPNKKVALKSEENGWSATDSGDAKCKMCNQNFNPICGVNGVTYTNLCQLTECARVRKANDGPCGIPDWVKPTE